METSVTQEQIDALLDQSVTEEVTFFGKDHVVCYLLPNGFTVIGRGACVDPTRFDLNLGRQYARQDAANQLWKLEGYLLQNNLRQRGIL